MNKLQSFSIGLVLLVLSAAALLQIIDVDPVMRRVSIGAVSAICLMAALVFFLFSFTGQDSSQNDDEPR